MSEKRAARGEERRGGEEEHGRRRPKGRERTEGGEGEGEPQNTAVQLVRQLVQGLKLGGVGFGLVGLKRQSSAEP